MNIRIFKIIVVALLPWILLAKAPDSKESEGYKLFKEYCWGCHHQSAEAFGPSFRSIANKRTPQQIMAQIVDPKSVSKTLGYKRNSMPPFNDLNASQIESLTNFIISFKDKK